jgi:hypothetical protein
MSPNSYVCFKNGLLRGYPGEEEVEPASFTWTYHDFEEYAGECITPSMYRFMAEYVHENISKEVLYDIQCGDYCPGELEEEAVNAYFDLPILVRINMHENTLKALQNKKAIAEAKEAAAIDAMLDDTTPFGTDNPINHEYTEFIRGLVTENRTKVDRLENEILEEEQWRGGHEDGESDTEQENYDPLEA